uniref:Uncharacterized protein LOC104244799 n=1 Tax=Nicotiana sylvestris TaxID=4096 RepID=A0A1U7Y641_NICSY|nr:PREDICTED: uncharacterized protein LOC104244799 [Nicotiana sylvestris]
MEGRSWKNISHRFGWKVKTHGFPIRGVSVDTIVASRVSLARAQDIILSSSSKRKVDVTQGSEEEEEHDGSSLIRRSRARKRVFSDDEATPRSVSITEPVEATLVSSDDDTHVVARGSDEHLFSRGFDSENLDLVSDEVHLAFYTVSAPMERSLLVFTTIVSAPPQAVMTSSTIPITIISHTEIGSSSESRAMKQIIIEVPANGNLLKKSGQADVWLKPLIGPVEKSKLESHSSLTWMNDIVQSSLKINLIGTEMIKRVSHMEQLMHDYQVEADNWKEQYESFQLDMEVLEENKCTLEQQLKVLISELVVEKASSNQASKDKNLLESSFSEQLSKASKEIRRLKVLLDEKEVYVGEPVQTLTPTQEDLHVSSDKVRFLESSLAPLQSSYDAALAEREELKNEIDQWERDYEVLEDKAAVEVSWDILNTRHDTLVEASQ